MPCAVLQTNSEIPVLPSAQPASVEFTYWYLLSIPALFLFLSLFKLPLEVFISQNNPYGRYLYQKDLVMVGLRGQHVWSGSALCQALAQLTYINRSTTVEYHISIFIVMPSTNSLLEQGIKSAMKPIRY